MRIESDIFQANFKSGKTFWKIKLNYSDPKIGKSPYKINPIETGVLSKAIKCFEIPGAL